MCTSYLSVQRSPRSVLCGAILALCMSAATMAKEVNAPEAEALPSVDTALTTLLGDAAKTWSNRSSNLAAQPVVVADASASPMRVVVKPGDTVDGLLRKHLGESAFSQKFLRQALIRLNPAVFAQGNVHRLDVGSTLLIPNEQTLVALLPTQKSSAVSIPLGNSQGTVPHVEDQTGKATSAWRPEQKNWVRYP